MQKTIFHNNKSTSQNEDIKNLEQVSFVNKKVNVDINKLLNRVKLKEKKEKKEKFIFLGIAILVLGLMGIFITFIK
jgi:hypothetical protein